MSPSESKDVDYEKNRNRDDQRGTLIDRYNRAVSQSSYSHHNRSISSSQDKREDKLSLLHTVFNNQSKPVMPEVVVDVLVNNSTPFRNDHRGNKGEFHSMDRREISVQTQDQVVVRDAYTESRSASGERRNLSTMSQAELPNSLSILPTAILERPSLEDASDFKKNSNINLKVPAIRGFGVASRQSAVARNKDHLTRASARARLGISSVNSSTLNSSRLSTRAKQTQPRPGWNSSGRLLNQN